MTRRILNTGGSANDGTGDTLREASEKINLNFQELYEITTLGDVTAEFLSNYVTNAVDSAMDGIDLSGVIANQGSITLLDTRVTQHDSILIGCSLA